MRTKPLAKALTHHSYHLGGPFKLWGPGYLIALFVWVVTGLTIWELVFGAIAWHLFVKFKFEKDEYFISYFLDSMFEKEHLEP